MTPFCSLCGRERPEGRTETDCVPCSNTGHHGHIIADMDDLWRSISIWAKYAREHDLTPEQISTSPSNRKRAMAAAIAIGNMKLYHMILGECVVCSEQDMDDMIDCRDIASCNNRRQCGVRDQYVSWIIHPPSDLEFRKDVGMNQSPVGSGKYTSELEKPHEVCH